MTCTVEGEKACVSSNESLTLGVEIDEKREMRGEIELRREMELRRETEKSSKL